MFTKTRERINTHTHAHTHKASVLCTIERARESILVSVFFFFVALYSVVGAAHLFISVPFYSLSHQLKTYKMDDILYSWVLYGGFLAALLCLKLCYFPVYSHYFSTVCPV